MKFYLSPSYCSLNYNHCASRNLSVIQENSNDSSHVIKRECDFELKAKCKIFFYTTVFKKVHYEVKNYCVFRK